MFNTVNSIAKQINSQTEICNIYWLIRGILSLIGGIVVFLLHHYFKGLFLDGKPNPRIRIAHDGKKKKKIKLSLLDNGDIEGKVAQELQVKLDELKKQHPLQNVDPFQDMNLVFASNYNAANNYNVDVQDYVEGKSQYYSRTIRDEVMSQCYNKVVLVLMTKGRKACKYLNIELVITGENIHVYSAESRQIKKGKHDEAPEKNSVDRSSDLYAFFPNEQVEYEYGEWQLKNQPSMIRCTCSEIVSGCTNSEVVPSLFVDTRYKQVIKLKWKINGADIREKGVNGELQIVVG